MVGREGRYDSYNSGEEVMYNRRIVEHWDSHGEVLKLNRYEPYVFSIETTNKCNMRCGFCPRTKLMTRQVIDMDFGTFVNVAALINRKNLPTVGGRYSKFDENKFDKAISSSHLTLHGYGEPLLDKLIELRVRMLSLLGFKTYLSCVPRNVKYEKLKLLSAVGLNAIKISAEGMNKDVECLIRQWPFSMRCFPCKVDQGNEEDNKRFMDTFSGIRDVYPYIKSQDNQWHKTGADNKSAVWNRPCLYPWTSLSIMAGGEIVPCNQDYNCEMVMDNINNIENLSKVFNNKKWSDFRQAHLTGIGLPDKCKNRCDMRKVYEVLHLGT